MHQQFIANKESLEIRKWTVCGTLIVSEAQGERCPSNATIKMAFVGNINGIW
jgi:hypothetical protein